MNVTLQEFINRGFQHLTTMEYIRVGLEDDPVDSTWRLTDQHRTNRAKAELLNTFEPGERELLTARAAAHLFGKTRNAAAQAAHREAVEVVFTRQDGTNLLRISSLIDYWGEPDADRLYQMRDDGYLLYVHHFGSYLLMENNPVLQPSPSI